MRTGGGRSSSGHSQLASYTACAYTTSGITSTRYAPCCALVACLIPTKHALAFHAAGVRPSQNRVANEAATDDWLVKNVCVAGCDDSCHETTEDNRYRVYLPDDLVARGRELHDREQLRAWPYFWADRELELRWLGLDIGFGVFAACTLTKQCSMLHIQGVADYDVRDPHALVAVWGLKFTAACRGVHVRLFASEAHSNSTMTATAHGNNTHQLRAMHTPTMSHQPNAHQPDNALTSNTHQATARTNST